MALSNPRVGARITHSIGRPGEKQDLWPARIVSPPTYAVGANGRLQHVATIITEQVNMSGEKYLGEKIANLQFAFDRTERCEALDGSAAEPKTVAELIADRNSQLMAYLASREQVVDAAALD